MRENRVSCRTFTSHNPGQSHEDVDRTMIHPTRPAKSHSACVFRFSASVRCEGCQMVDGLGNDQEVLFKEDGDCFASGPTYGTVACALMLAGNWRKALQMACDEPYEAWVGTVPVRMAVRPVIMAWLAEWPKLESPTGVSGLLAAALGLFGEPVGWKGLHTRQRVLDGPV